MAMTSFHQEWNSPAGDDTVQEDSPGASEEVSPEKSPEHASAAEEPHDLKHPQLSEVPQPEMDYHEAWLRACAEMENLRRRKARELEESVAYANGRFAQELLSVADNLQRALSSVPPEAQHTQPLQGFYEGVALTQKTLEKVFENFGMHKMQVLHEAFNPVYHEAVGQEVKDDIAPGHVTTVLQEGYKLKDRVLRPALVILSQSGASS